MSLSTSRMRRFLSKHIDQKRVAGSPMPPRSDGVALAGATTESDAIPFRVRKNPIIPTSLSFEESVASHVLFHTRQDFHNRGPALLIGGEASLKRRREPVRRFHAFRVRSLRGAALPAVEYDLHQMSQRGGRARARSRDESPRNERGRARHLDTSNETRRLILPDSAAILIRRTSIASRLRLAEYRVGSPSHTTENIVQLRHP